MTRKRSNILCCFRLDRLLLCGCLLLAQPALAQVPLRAFTADYDLYQNGMHVATSQLSLQQSGQAWRWVMRTSARGVYAWFIKRKPYAETIFTLDGDEIELQQVIVTDSKNKKKYESASFDWSRRELKVLRKGKHKSLPLEQRVYDYQSIHVLAAAMQLRRQKSVSVDFYRKGRVVRSHLVFSGEGQVAIDGENIGANIYDQVIDKSKSKLRYYYAADNPLLPLRIEKFESGDGPVVMTLKRVDWVL